MIWLTWRQHRRQVLFLAIALAVLAAALVPSGLAMRHTYDDLGLAGCIGQRGSQDCSVAMRQFTSRYGTLGMVGTLLVFLPLLVGLFWGAPLVAREVEHGTHRLVWTQGISRQRWALVKIGFVGAVTLVAAVGYGLGVGWWYGPLTAAARDAGRFGTLFFDVQGVVPIGYTLFAVALGVFAGTVWRRVLPAMAVTLVGFLGLRIALTGWVRPRFLPPKELTILTADTTPAVDVAQGDWVIAQNVRTASGRVVLANAQVNCPPGEGPCGELGPGAYNWIQYQPGDRYWLFQYLETGIFVALAALLLYLAVRRVRRIA